MKPIRLAVLTATLFSAAVPFVSLAPTPVGPAGPTSAGLTSAGLTSAIASPATLPFGPGAVVDAVEGFLAAIDRGDASALRSRLRSAHGYRIAEGEDGRQVEGPCVWDVAHDGAPIRAESEVALAAQTLAGLAQGDLSIRLRSTKILEIVADCPSGECSYATVRFERTWGEGELAVVQPLRATALVAWSKDAKPGEPRCRVFHWNAGPDAK